MDRSAFESSGYLIQALVDDARIHVVVELLVDAVRDLMQIRVDGGCAGARVSRQETGHELRCHCRGPTRKIRVRESSGSMTRSGQCSVAIDRDFPVTMQ